MIYSIPELDYGYRPPDSWPSALFSPIRLPLESATKLKALWQLSLRSGCWVRGWFPPSPVNFMLNLVNTSLQPVAAWSCDYCREKVVSQGLCREQHHWLWHVHLSKERLLGRTSLPVATISYLLQKVTLRSLFFVQYFNTLNAITSLLIYLSLQACVWTWFIEWVLCQLTCNRLHNIQRGSFAWHYIRGMMIATQSNVNEFWESPSFMLSCTESYYYLLP